MRETFRGYYRPSESEMKLLWAEGLIVLDTNVLLSLYEYSEATRSSLLTLLRDNCSRVWLPHQVGLEFQRNRLSRISQGMERRQEVAAMVDSLIVALGETFDPVDNGVKNALLASKNFVAKRIEHHEKTVGGEMGGGEDDIRSDLDSIYDGRLGAPPTDQWMDVAKADALDRIDRHAPPGFHDAKKPEDRAIGDCLLWLQVLEEAEKRALPVILVTEERKADWWQKHKGKISSPRPELIEEFWSRVGKPFWLYRTDSFLFAAREHLDDAISDEAVSEVQLVSDRFMEEERRRQARRRESKRRRAEERSMMRFLQDRVDSGSASVAELRDRLDQISQQEASAASHMQRLESADSLDHETLARVRAELALLRQMRDAVAADLERLADEATDIRRMKARAYGMGSAESLDQSPS